MWFGQWFAYWNGVISISATTHLTPPFSSISQLCPCGILSCFWFIIRRHACWSTLWLLPCWNFVRLCGRGIEVLRQGCPGDSLKWRSGPSFYQGRYQALYHGRLAECELWWHQSTRTFYCASLINECRILLPAARSHNLRGTLSCIEVTEVRVLTMWAMAALQILSKTSVRCHALRCGFVL